MIYFKIKKILTAVCILALFPVTAFTKPPHPKLPETFLPVPIMRQATDYSCGAASLLAVLYYWKTYGGTESSLYLSLKTSEEYGTDYKKIGEVAKQFGLEAQDQENLTLSDLRQALKREETVILDLQAWRDSKNKHIPWSETWEDGHYVVLIAMDNHYAYVMDPSAGPGYAYLSLKELLERWHDYENRKGYIQRYYQLGIIIHGQTSLKNFPAPLVRME